MTRSRKEAIAFGKSKIGDSGWERMCQKFVRTCFDLGGGFGSAGEQWRGAQFRHPTDDYSTVPRGVPFFWDTTSVHEHVALTLGRDEEGYRLCLSTDAFRADRIDVVRMATLERNWGARPLGWTEDMNGTRVYTPPKPKVETPNFDRIVEFGRLARDSSQGSARDDAQKIINLARPHSTRY